MKAKQTKQYRHGDLLIESVAQVPEGATLAPERKQVLAEGKATGHAHRLELGDLYLGADGELYFSSKKNTAVRHEEHARIELPAGSYRVVRQREYQPAAPPRQVVD